MVLDGCIEQKQARRYTKHNLSESQGDNAWLVSLTHRASQYSLATEIKNTFSCQRYSIQAEYREDVQYWLNFGPMYRVTGLQIEQKHHKQQFISLLHLITI